MSCNYDSIYRVVKYFGISRSSHLQMFLKICCFFLFFCNIHKKTPVLDLFFYKVASLRACSFIKKRLQHSFFYRTPPLAAFGPQRISKRMILTKFWNLNMLPKDIKRSRKKHLHKKCACFTSKKNYQGSCFQMILRFLLKVMK